GPIYRRLLARRRRPLRLGPRRGLAAGGEPGRVHRSRPASLRHGGRPAGWRRLPGGGGGGGGCPAARSRPGRRGAEAPSGGVELHALLASSALSFEGRAALRRSGLLGRPVVEFVRRNHGRFKNGDLVAWDLCRLINVARYGFSAGLLPEEEAWGAILAAARLL